MVKKDSNERLEIVEQNYDDEKHITSMKFPSFLREDEKHWKKVEEVPGERSYSFEKWRKIY